MDNFLILLQAKLDEAKSINNLNGSNGDIAKLQKKLDALKLQVTLDPKAAQNLSDEVGKLINQKIVISNIDVDTSQTAKAGKIAGEEFNKGVSRGLDKSSNILNNFKKSLESIGMGSKEIDAVADRINNLGVQIETLSQTRSSGKKDILSVNIAGIDRYGQAIKLTQQYNIATGELVNAIDAVSTAQQGIGNNTNSIKKAENVFADYTAKIEQFKSTNSNILSGLSDPLSDFENKLSGLKTGITSIDEVINSYKNLNAKASKITSNLSAQFNKVDSAVRNIAKGDEAIASLRADFKGLSNAPKEVNSELSKCEKLLLNVINIELQEGRTVNWSAAYKEWEQSIDSLKAKISTLKKEQSNVASTQVFNTKDLDSQSKIYIQKVNNTIEKTKSELESKLRNAGYMDIQIKGVEDATGKIKSLTATVTDATGAFKQLNFERAKIQGSGKAQAGFVQTDDVKVVGNISASIDKVQSNLSSLKTKWEEQGVLVGEFKTKVEQLESSLSSVGSKGELNALKTQIQDLKSEVSTIAQVHEIQLSIGDKGDVTTQVKTLSDNFTKLGLSADEVKSKMNGVDVELTELKSLLNSGANNSAIITQFDKMQSVLKETQNDLKTTRSEYSLLVSAQQRLNKANTIEAWKQKNSAATKQAQADAQVYIDTLRNLNVQMTKMEFEQISRGFKETEISMRGLNKLGASLKDQFSQAAQSFTQWLSVSSGIMALVYQLQRMPKEVYEIDTAMTNLYKVTDETDKKYTQFLSSASNSAHELGRSISSLVEQTANWAKLGFSLDEAEQLAKISSIYANVGEVDNDTAVSDIVTAMKAFNIEASDSITIVDKLNKLGNEYATSAAALGDGLSRSASAMATSGTDINKTLAMLTGGTEITQNASEFGNFLKIGSMRIRGMKGDLEALGEEVDETVDSISKVQTQILNRTGGKVNIFDDAGNFRDYYDIMKDISEVYDDLNDPDKADLTEILFGKQRGNQGAALIQAFQSGQIQKALEATLNAEGSAMQEQERWLESLEAKTQQFEAAFQSLSNTVVDSDMLKSIVDLGTIGVSALERFINTLEYVNSWGGNTKSFFGSLGAISGLLMNKMGIGERTMFQW